MTSSSISIETTYKHMFYEINESNRRKLSNKIIIIEIKEPYKIININASNQVK